METSPLAGLHLQAELLTPLSISHLTADTRAKLANNDLSVDASPTGGGGLVRVGTASAMDDGRPSPAEPDLATIFAVAEQAGIAWLKFDAEAEVVSGLPVFTPGESRNST
jgi:hypothetical protein